MTAPRLTAAELAAAIRSAPADSPLAELSRWVIRYFDVLDAHRVGADPYRSDGLRRKLDRAESAVRAAVALPSSEEPDSPHAELSRLVIRYLGVLDDHRAGGDPYRPDGLGPALDRAEWDVRKALGLQSADDDEREPLPLLDVLRSARAALQPDRATQQRVWRRLQAAQSAPLPWWRRAWRRLARRRRS